VAVGWWRSTLRQKQAVWVQPQISAPAWQQCHSNTPTILSSARFPDRRWCISCCRALLVWTRRLRSY
jgi:hypothetical protein